jgi:putative Mg2+ transporter-C (MgtC) family protein
MHSSAADAVLGVSTQDMVIRILIAGALGGLIGFEREISEQPAGFRTHILVSLGAALFTMVGAYAVVGPNIDPTRIAAQVVTGIGFIGAGVIFQQGFSVRGLTTAASLWVTAAIGTATALGYWAPALTTAFFTVATLYGLKRFGEYVFPRLRKGHPAPSEEPPSEERG